MGLLLHFARTTYAIAQLLHFDIVERDPDRRAAIEPARFDHTALGPVVNNTREDSQASRELVDGQLLGSLERRSRYSMLPADPPDRVERMTSSGRAELAEPIEFCDDLSIGQRSGEVANVRNDWLRIADSLGPWSRQI